MSGHMRERRFEVVAETRRRWSREEKLAFVAEASGPCTNISAVARRHGLSPALLYRWKKELGSSSDSSALVPVSVVSDVSIPDAPKPPSVIDAELEIVLGNGRRVRVSQDIDVAALKRLVAALDG